MHLHLILFLIGLVYIIACVFLILVILLQSGKGGGLSGMLGGSNPLTDTFGSSGAEKTLSKWTTVCAVAFFFMALVLTLMGNRLMKPTRLSDQLKAGAAPAQQAPSVSPGSQPDQVGEPGSETSQDISIVTPPEQEEASPPGLAPSGEPAMPEVPQEVTPGPGSSE